MSSARFFGGCGAPLLGALVLFAAASPRAADRDDATQNLMRDLGDVLAAEEFCGLSYDQQAIRSFIEKNVPRDDMGFAGDLASHADDLKWSLYKEMTPSQKTAYCTQEARVAKHYGFTR
jgi:hypothetical protein